MSARDQLEQLRAGVVAVYSDEELDTLVAGGRPLRVKLGVDPTAPDIHLGHTVALTKLRQFQDFGHTGVLIIGDFTARVGDPSGRSATRPQLDAATIERNARTYQEQVFKILDPARTEVRRNSEWFASMTMEGVLRLSAQMTVARMLEREDFKERHRGGVPISLHEFLYPLMQGYDSVMVRADVELGGTDQTFNLLVGRDLQRDAGQSGQVAIVVPLLEGLDGVQKMSKSLGNHVGVSDSPEDMFGKIMSASDPLMLRYYTLLSRVSAARRQEITRGSVHPMEAKKALARELVARFHGEEAAERAAGFFEQRFQKRTAHAPTEVAIETSEPDVGICQLIKQVGFAPSTSEAKRLVAQGAVRVDGRRVEPDYRFRGGVDRLLEVGKRRLADVRFVPPSKS